MHDDELYHFGVKGMKWGVRRYEDKSGHLTPAGKKRYDYGGDKHKQKNNMHKRYKNSLTPEERKRVQSEARSRLSDENAKKFADRHRTGLRVAKTLLVTGLMDSTAANVNAALLNAGQDGAAKAISTLESLGSWAYLGSSLYSIYQDKQLAKD